jgi:hypothetical protein
MDAQRSGDKLFASGAVDHLEIEFEFSSLTFWQGLIFFEHPRCSDISFLQAQARVAQHGSSI